jgi:hypothetical protein
MSGMEDRRAKMRAAHDPIGGTELTAPDDLPA